MTRILVGLLGVLAVVNAGAGCALASKGEALSIRWFTPESTTPRITSASEPETEHARGEAIGAIELGRVTSGAHLRERIAYRDRAFEVGYYDDKRWTERPEAYVRRELARRLFEERGFRRAVGGQAPILDVEVLSFEEIRGAVHAARIQLRAVLHDDRTALVERTVNVERAIPPGASDIDGLVFAMSQALQAAAEDVAALTAAAAASALRERGGGG
jgi:cholesterol transport system auxiliary component